MLRLATVICTTFIAIFTVYHPPPAEAHKWYDYECCHENDCAPVTKLEFRHGFSIWYTKHWPNGYPIDDVEYAARRKNGKEFKIKPSMDHQRHLCARDSFKWQYGTKEEKPKSYADRIFKSILYCIYLPAGS